MMPIALVLTLSCGLISLLTLLLVWRPLSKWWNGTPADSGPDPDGHCLLLCRVRYMSHGLLLLLPSDLDARYGQMKKSSIDFK